MYWIELKYNACNFLTEIKHFKVYVCAVEIYTADIVCSRQDFKSVTLNLHVHTQVFSKIISNSAIV
jgi:hypothetical protein